MSAVERVEYMDNQRSSQIAETIQREQRLQREYFKKQEAAGLIKPRAPTPPAPTKTLLETIGAPPHVQAVNDDPIQAMNTSISKSMWTSNPGYLVRNGPAMASHTHKSYTYDQEELEYMKSLGYLDKTHNRRRDEFVMYVEASARMTHLTNNAKHCHYFEVQDN